MSTFAPREQPGFFLTFEQLLSNDLERSLSEGSLFFEGKGAVQATLKKVSERLADLKIPYAIVGGMALNAHGYRRFTEDVDILVRREDLKRIHSQLEGRGYLRPFMKSKNLRDTETRVRIEFLLTGDYPGDGKVKPIAFPNPVGASVEINGVSYLNLHSIIELKLASGLSNQSRQKDLADVQELIRTVPLERTTGEQIHESVRAKYFELWDGLHEHRRRYVTLWRNKFLTVETQSIEQMADTLEDASRQLREMIADGVQLDPQGGAADDYAYLFTYDPAIARKYHMEDENEYFGDDEIGHEPPEDTLDEGK